MNAAEKESTFVPKQAILPTPQVYDDLVADTMEKLAAASIAHVLPLSDGDIIHDNGCGTGAGTVGIIESIKGISTNISIKASDINGDALKVYQEQVSKNS